MTLYETVIDTNVVNSSHTQIVDLVGEGASVLDVGCSVGYLADALNERGCTVSGFEYDAEAAERARPKLDQLVVGDLNELPLAEAFAGRTFDRIVFGDVLEHLIDPVAVLRSAVEILAPEGQIVISIPNVAHGSLRLALLQGRWRYRDTGLLDRTHIRFFTLESLHEMLVEAGLAAKTVRATTADPLAVEVEIDADRIPGEVVEWVRHQPRALDYQYVLSAVVQDPESPGSTPPVEHVVPDELVRIADVHTQRAAEAAEVEHHALRIRDHVIGLEAQVGRAEAEIKKLQEKNEGLYRELVDVIEDRQQIRSSSTWRAGRALTAPIRLVKRAVR
ncbi:class I SAM-dependent methyltransferase [Oerskovia jenensis]|uniref:2-polyprenyl-3-methyl-5-hydroxy-6-metoxy-1, 4-benzoquinol methylase n=1 Tax=Oerskovia jenensis TaxID=162169 RepID=A0ABS2LIV0_9CELL|nr:class I SAM-dependent methyltransferase [Oerskovia jenensis]MBM7480358.1 2-polyprenyl-3-methyl-5-hydroxy-6-metoxy-1,4-benzoquinol methylase [Oerskovia jenensis]